MPGKRGRKRKPIDQPASQSGERTGANADNHTPSAPLSPSSSSAASAASAQPSISTPPIPAPPCTSATAETQQLTRRFTELIRGRRYEEALTVGTKAASERLLDLSVANYEESAVVALVRQPSRQFDNPEEERRIVTALFELIVANGGLKHLNDKSLKCDAPLLHACRYPPSIMAAELLASHPAVDINARCARDGWTVLMFAVHFGLVGVCERLLSRTTEIDLSPTNNFGQTAEQIVTVWRRMTALHLIRRTD